MASGARITIKPVSLMATSVDPLTLPLGNGNKVEVGHASIALDVGSDGQEAGGWIDISTGDYELKVPVQLTAPGLVDLVKSGGLDPSVAGPLRTVYTLAGRVDESGNFTSDGQGRVSAGSLWEGTVLREDCASCCLRDDVTSSRRGESAEQAILKGDSVVCTCTCKFGVEFPARLGGGSTPLSIRTVFVAQPDRGALGYKGKMLGLLSRLCGCEEARPARDEGLAGRRDDPVEPMQDGSPSRPMWNRKENRE